MFCYSSDTKHENKKPLKPEEKQPPRAVKPAVEQNETKSEESKNSAETKPTSGVDKSEEKEDSKKTRKQVIRTNKIKRQVG